VYLASVPTRYRILHSVGEVRERRRQAVHLPYIKLELVADRPNRIWSWDITKLLGPQKWTYYYLYVVLNIFSRYVVGWMLAARESASLAERLLADSVRKQGVERDQLTIHADRGSSMRSKPVALLLSDLGVTKSHSRPHCSNDNPYSEAQFKTLRTGPGSPIGSAQDARDFCRRFFGWYNDDHRHSGIGYHTPADVHYGRADQVRADRAVILSAAHQAHPRTLRAQAAAATGPPASGPDQPASTGSRGTAMIRRPLGRFMAATGAITPSLWARRQGVADNRRLGRTLDGRCRGQVSCVTLPP
jgi:putative transposase